VDHVQAYVAAGVQQFSAHRFEEPTTRELRRTVGGLQWYSDETQG
jgi:hypothetical protein